MPKFSYHDFLAHFGVGGAHPGGLSLTKEIIKKVGLHSRSKVLDVGCGTGQTSSYLAHTYHCDITSVDPHPLMLQKAKERFMKDQVKVKLIHGKAENIPLLDNDCDLLLAESVTVFADIPQSLREFVRVLRSGGIAIDLEMTAVTPFSNEQLLDFMELYGIKSVPTENEWKDLFIQAGFKSVQIMNKGLIADLLAISSSSDTSSEINPSSPLDPELYNIWGNHQSLTEKYAKQLEYVVYRAEK